EAAMADIEMQGALPEPTDAEDCFGLGMNYSSGAGVAVDLIEAHKWFNIAAMRGHADAAQLRREIAEQMADAEIGRARRAIGLKPIRRQPSQRPPSAPRLDLLGSDEARQLGAQRRDHARPIAERGLTQQPRLRVPGAVFTG